MRLHTRKTGDGRRAFPALTDSTKKIGNPSPYASSSAYTCTASTISRAVFSSMRLLLK